MLCSLKLRAVTSEEAQQARSEAISFRSRLVSDAYTIGTGPLLSMSSNRLHMHNLSFAQST